MRIPVRKMVNGESFAFPLPGCTDVAVNVVNSYRRVSLSYTIDVKEDNVLNARVEGEAEMVVRHGYKGEPLGQPCTADTR